MRRLAALIILVIGLSAIPVPSARSQAPHRLFLPIVARGVAGTDPIVDPPVIASDHGLLETTITASLKPITVSGRSVQARVYNGLFQPPTLRIRPGDTVAIQFQNALDQATNLHFHGLGVTPQGSGDNIFITVPPGGSFQYQFTVPIDQPSGLYWYHPHEHKLAEVQIASGLAGAIVVEGLLDPLPELQGITERLLLLKDLQVSADGTIPYPQNSNAPTIRLINGQLNPAITIRPGETQLWRIANQSANIFYRLALDGHQLTEIARDGNRLLKPVVRDEIVLPSGARTEVLVTGGAVGGYQLRTLPYSLGGQADQYPAAALATVAVAGDPAIRRTVPALFPPIPDLRDQPVAQQRRIAFSQGRDKTVFFIDGKEFDPGRTDIVARQGTVEEWTIQNNSLEGHVFHLHQTPFQVISANGQVVAEVNRHDSLEIGPVGRAVIRIPFGSANIVGRFVYHCHIIGHEDRGMMAVIEVLPEDLSSATGSSKPLAQPLPEPRETSISFDDSPASGAYCPLPDTE